MKNAIFILMIAGIALAFYGQNLTPANLWMTLAGIVIFMMGMMWLSSKTPSKNQDQEDDEIQ